MQLLLDLGAAASICAEAIAVLPPLLSHLLCKCQYSEKRQTMFCIIMKTALIPQASLMGLWYA